MRKDKLVPKWLARLVRWAITHPDVVVKVAKGAAKVAKGRK